MRHHLQGHPSLKGIRFGIILAAMAVTVAGCAMPPVTGVIEPSAKRS